MGGNLVPHRRSENDFPQCIVAAQFLEHEKVLCGRALHAYVSDAVEVYNAVQQHLVAIGGSEPAGNLAEHVGVASVCVVEAGSIDEVDCSGRRELVRININVGRALGFAQCVTG